MTLGFAFVFLRRLKDEHTYGGVAVVFSVLGQPSLSRSGHESVEAESEGVDGAHADEQQLDFVGENYEYTGHLAAASVDHSSAEYFNEATPPLPPSAAL